MRKGLIVGTTLAFALAVVAVATHPEKGNTFSLRKAASATTADGEVSGNWVRPGGSGGGFTGNPVLSHSNSDEIAAGNSVACCQFIYTTENHFYRSFDLAFFGVVGDYVTAFIEVGIQANTGSVEYPAFAVVYNDVNGGEPFLNDLDELASLDFPIPPGFMGIIALPMTTIVPAGGTVVVELGYLGSNENGVDGGLWPGSNAAGQSAPSYIMSAPCGLPEIATTASIGFPDMHLVFKAHNTSACCSPSRTCSVVTQQECDDQGGTFFPAQDCNTVYCACGPDSGDCLDPGGNGTPGCDDIECCVGVCEQDAFCCDFAWNSDCADLASELCVPLVPPPNDDCEDADFFAFAGGGGTHAFEGNSVAATNDCDLLGEPEVWISFSIEEQSDVEINMCDSPDFFELNSTVLTVGCPCESTVEASFFEDDCLQGPDGANATRKWNCLPSGTYYYNILGIGGSQGDYVATVIATTPDDLCDPCDLNCPESNCSGDSCSLVQNACDDIGTTQIACGAGGLTTENSFGRCFDLEEEGITTALNIDSVTFIVGQLASTTNDAVTVNINLYTDTCPPSFGTQKLIGSQTVVVDASQVGDSITVDFPGAPLVPAGSALVVEIEAPEDGTPGTPGNNHAFRPMANDEGECAPSYLKASQCGLNDWIRLSDLGFFSSHTYMSVAGTLGAVPVCGGSEILSASPADGAVDARQPHPPGPGEDQDPANRQGIGSSDEPIVLEIDAAGNAANCFELCETSADGILGPNGIASVTECPAGTYSIVLNHAIAPGAWTSISVGTVSVSYNSHPANVDAGQFSNASDVLALIDILNDVAQPVWGDLSTDIDHSGVFGAADVLRVIDLLNGAIPYAVWNGVEAPTNTCP